MLKQLSKNQKDIVTAPIGKPLQVLASAGTGKTRVLTERIRFILANTKKDNVLALTFTNKAADEMKSRLSDSDEAEDRTWIATIHSVAQKIIERYGHTIGLPEELHIYERDQDRLEVFLQSLRDDGIDIDEYLDIEDSNESRKRERRLYDYLDYFAQIKRALLTEEDVKNNEDGDNLWNIYQDYQEALLNSGGIDYEDILVYALRLLMTHDWIAKIYRAKYKHVCIDEAQDLNKLQYEFIKVLCSDKKNSLMMVGDPAQMIYGFNGSSPEYLCTYFLRDFSPAQHSLNENFRSAQQIINVANRLNPNAQQQTKAAHTGIVKVHSHLNEEDEANWITNQIVDILKIKNHEEIEGNITLENIVVIARNRYVFSKLEKVLDEKNIGYFLKKGERCSEPTSTFGKTLDYAIRIKLNPKDWVDGKKLCSLLALSHPKSWGEEDILSQWANELRQKITSNFQILSLLLDEINGLDVATPNIRKLSTNFRKQLETIALEANFDSEKLELERSIEELEDFQRCWTNFKIKGMGSSLQAFRNSMALGQVSQEKHTDGLSLSTVHTMKGLEKDVVFLMGMCEGTFPDYRATTPKELNEEQNNAFVAVTRAKRWLFITYPLNRQMPWGATRAQTPSRFVNSLTDKNIR